MRLFIAATVVASLFATNLLAAEAVAPLAAGQPAGVKKAQDADNTLWWVLGGAAAVTVIAVVASDNGSDTPAATTTK